MTDLLNRARASRARHLGAFGAVALLLGSCATGGSEPIVGPPPPPSCTTTPPAAVATYYAATVNQCGAALLQALHNVIDGHTVLGYTSARDSLYDFIDRGDQTWIRDIYTGREAVGVTTRATAADNNINTEHLWPRSRGAEYDPSLSDLHHLASADETANSQRSNHPFGIVNGTVLWTGPAGPGGPTDVSRLGYASGTSGTLVFEPRPSKRGDVARALLYFYVRYNTERPTGFSLENFAAERAFLLQWVAADPPDDWERARNAGVQRAQGNRNPFIDWPELVTLIGEFPIN